VSNGKRCFVLGLYQVARDDDFAAEVAQAGFNLIRVERSRDALNLAHAHGLQCWIPLGEIAVSTDAEEARLKSVVDSLKSHPALAVWEGPDEVLWNVWWTRWNLAVKGWNMVEEAVRRFEGTRDESENLKSFVKDWRRYRVSGRYAQAEASEEQIRKLVGLPPAGERLSEWRDQLDPLLGRLGRGARVVRETDSEHVIWFNHAPRNTVSDLTRFGAVADVVGCDIYPVPFGPSVGHSDLAERNLASVGHYTRRMAQSASGKPVWMVLQGFGWDDIGEGNTSSRRPRPTFEQTRFMAYDAIANGARGILYWGTFAIERDSPLWSDIKTVISELRDLQPFLSAVDATHRVTLDAHPTSGSDEKGLILLAKERDGEWAFIVVNEADQPIAFDISGIESLNGRHIDVLNEPESLVVKEGHLPYGLPGQSVSVLLTRR
jgi:hypothetical protein